MAIDLRKCETPGCETTLDSSYAHPRCSYCISVGASKTEQAAQRLDAERRTHADGLPPRPFVHHGEVLGQLYSELTQLIQGYQTLQKFEARVAEAAKSPAAWLQLRQELAK